MDLDILQDKTAQDVDSNHRPIVVAPFRKRKTRRVMVGSVPVGGDAPISVQTMTKTKTADARATVEQIERCAEAGVDIVRVTVNDKHAAAAMPEIVAGSPVPIVSDIHFNHVFALKALEAGVAKVRINPGNIGKVERIQEVLEAAKDRRVPIRIGVNSGSLEKDILEKHGYPRLTHFSRAQCDTQKSATTQVLKT